MDKSELIAFLTNALPGKRTIEQLQYTTKIKWFCPGQCASSSLSKQKGNYPGILDDSEHYYSPRKLENLFRSDYSSWHVSKKKKIVKKL